MEIIRDAAAICSELTVILGALALLIKPLRKRFLGQRQMEDGQRCLLRSEMLHTYYKNREARQIRQYEYENFTACHKAYKALGGNSFIDHIYAEINEWEVVT